MAWTTPRTWVVSELVDDIIMNSAVRDNLAYLKGSAGVIYLENAIEVPEISTPTTPASGRTRFFVKNDKLPYMVDSNGVQMVLGGYRARIYNNVDITLTTASATALTFNSERFDTGNFHDNSVNNSRLTIPKSGTYVLGGTIVFASNATGIREVYLQNSAGVRVVDELLAPVSGNSTRFSFSTMYEFTIGDYVQCFAYQNSGGDLNITSAAAYSPELWIYGPI